MKVYYIFKIKKEFINLYEDTPSVLYKILKTIFYLNKDDLDFGSTIFTQLIIPVNKNELNKNIFIKHHQDLPYCKRGNTHYINNLYLDEVSRLKINNYYIKLEEEQNFSSFFKILREEESNLFACSFKSQDFFFLDKY